MSCRSSLSFIGVSGPVSQAIGTGQGAREPADGGPEVARGSGRPWFRSPVVQVASSSSGLWFGAGRASRRRDQDLIDDVDGAVGGLDVAASYLRAVDLVIVSGLDRVDRQADERCQRLGGSQV